MKTQGRERSISFAEERDYRIITVLFAVCASFVLGAIPILFGLGITSEANGNNTNIQPTEMTPWSVLGE